MTNFHQEDPDSRLLLQKLRTLSATAAGEDPKSAVPSQGDPLSSALRILAREYRLPMIESSLSIVLNDDLAKTRPVEKYRARLDDIALKNHWRIRKVSLPENFYLWNSSPLLAFLDEGQVPVVLHLKGRGSSFYEPRSGREIPLTAENAGGFAPFAYRLYEPLPEQPLSWMDMAKFTLSGSRNALICIAFIGCLSGGLALIQPLAVEYVTGRIIPTANLPELWQLLVFLLALGVSQTFLGMVPNLYLLGLSTQRFERFAAAVFDRLFRIPVEFFRNYPAGDLSNRVTMLMTIQDSAFGVLVGQLTKSILSLLSLIMLFYYSWRLALVGLILTVTYCLALMIVLRRSVRALNIMAEARGRMSGMLVQFFEGIAKIRTSGAEKRIIARFLDDYTPALEATRIIQTNSGRLEMLSVMFPSVVSMVFFWLVGSHLAGSMSMPRYLAFISAFAGFQGGVIGLFNSIWKLWEIRPELERIKPVIRSPLENPTGQASPGVLDGKVVISQVTFRYQKDHLPVLEDVSIHANPGEFIAVVGPSGSGKSTLVRLLLGFERPEKGAVYYSDRDLSGLDLVAVRRQLGVIMQNTRVMPDSILSNIISGTDYSFEDAENAVRLASLDKDIAEMPMGMFTMVGEELLSGGQRQRLMIARALVGKPTVLIMDESTSALDNVTQNIVRQNIEDLKATRIVIAHRLSTIVKADRIYVLERGRVVQTGLFNELLAVPGPFLELAKHQLL